MFRHAWASTEKNFTNNKSPFCTFWLTSFNSIFGMAKLFQGIMIRYEIRIYPRVKKTSEIIGSSNFIAQRRWTQHTSNFFFDNILCGIIFLILFLSEANYSYFIAWHANLFIFVTGLVTKGWKFELAHIGKRYQCEPARISLHTSSIII